MAKLDFKYFMDYDNGKIARFETTGDEEGVPVNVFIDNYTEKLDTSERSCEVDIYGIALDTEVYATEEEYDASQSEFRMASRSMIPSGTFSPEGEGAQSPHIIYTGKVLDLETNPDPKEGEPDYLLHIDTYGFDFYLYLDCKEEIKEGYIVHGSAWIYTNI